MSTITVPRSDVTTEEAADARVSASVPATTCRPGRESTRAPHLSWGPIVGRSNPTLSPWRS
jgi:hypothetical protein